MLDVCMRFRLCMSTVCRILRKALQTNVRTRMWKRDEKNNSLQKLRTSTQIETTMRRESVVSKHRRDVERTDYQNKVHINKAAHKTKTYLCSFTLRRNKMCLGRHMWVILRASVRACAKACVCPYVSGVCASVCCHGAGLCVLVESVVSHRLLMPTGTQNPTHWKTDTRTETAVHSIEWVR